MLEAIRKFAGAHFGSPWRRHTRDFRDAAGTLQLAREWSVFHFAVGAQTAAAAYVAERGATLTRAEKQWLAAQQEAWLSVWEVLTVQPGHGFTARDLLSGEERTVRDASAAEALRARNAILARVVLWKDGSELWGVHPTVLTPQFSSQVVVQARKRLRLGSQGFASADMLRTAATGRFLIRAWESAGDRMQEEYRTLPRIATTDGETAVMCIIRYAFDPSERARVAEAVATIPQIVPPDADERGTEAPWIYRFTKAGTNVRVSPDGLDPRTVLGQVRIGKNELLLETDARERREILTALLTDAAGRWLRELARSEDDLREISLRKYFPAKDAVLSRSPKPTLVPPPQLIELVQTYKRDHYRKWLDERIPALGGKTPRQATRLVRGRRRLDVLLREMENRESQLPEWDRFDFSTLRDELGLDP